MKKSISFASTLALTGMLALPTIVSGAEAEAVAANSALGGAVGPAVTVGLAWCRVQQSYRALGDTRTWAYLESCTTGGVAPLWVWCNDNECEQILIDAAASAHYLGVNFTTTAGVFNYVILYKY